MLLVVATNAVEKLESTSCTFTCDRTSCSALNRRQDTKEVVTTRYFDAMKNRQYRTVRQGREASRMIQSSISLQMFSRGKKLPRYAELPVVFTSTEWEIQPTVCTIIGSCGIGHSFRRNLNGSRQILLLESLSLRIIQHAATRSALRWITSAE